MTVLSHISSFYSASWVGWVMFALFVVGIVNLVPQVEGVTLQRMFSHSERMYSARARDWMNEVILRIFRLGVMAMAVMIIWQMPGITPTFWSYMKVFALLAVVYGIQILLVYGVGMVFVSSKRMDEAMEQYSTIRTLACMGLYPIVLLLTNIALPIVAQVAYSVVVILYMAILFIKGIQLFFVHALSILYVLLYIICLEILPLFGSILLVKYII
ncbi:MAG: DUF4271 domain-containing protein [Paludibacteraceae bacterium]|jgi:hypothetical protein|nr:DUF4271 domain-containing protein [Paludibacteraceae bacterium]